MDIKTLTEEVEKVSQNYIKRYDIDRDRSWYVLKLQEELGELIQAFLILEGKSRTKGKSKEEMKADFDKEVADVFCHILLLSKHLNVDLEKVIADKWLSWNT